MAASVLAAVHAAIAALPESLWTSPEAVMALCLAEGMDNQIGGAAASKRISELLDVLRSADKPAGDALDDLTARREKRRGA